FITVSEPPIADPHDGWCGGCRRETCGYPINDKQSANVYLSGAFNNKTVQVTQCMENIEQFSMQLINNQTNQLIWSANKQFK
ncbi:MAG: penicillin-binding protein activator LpoB, partial [gamma proteobacterium symbiont of Lucinoma myriamae]|nr:penicillin-binding protein activator LpoB [gamma proteobacterium symbiont of Lucinoma myriamae]MCU7817610.1 penicillin-binding protein activator LpoB [gamma proteobacterium symbiont of Lucinoma myriamae]MCU7833476.1 penicillin-binding protein activator LpoB [gamma proteobacterium symbiont of Lucinoma myriamae]